MADIWKLNQRHARVHGPKQPWPRPLGYKFEPGEDVRSPWQKDRDRVLYSSALRRLGAVAQVVTSDQSGVFHNRLTHTMKVAQVGRRMAEYCALRQPELFERFGIDPDVVETACLVHDLGHPPFGHVGEHELDKLGKAAGCLEGYEGNAQSFRIVTKLALAKDGWPGLDLTLASLSAVQKYPWPRSTEKGDHRHAKWGYYSSEEVEFKRCREWLPEKARDRKSAEAELMDWADDITYSVHDIEDFHRARLIPWHMFRFSESDPHNSYKEYLISRALADWKRSGKVPEDALSRLRTAMARFEEVIRKEPHKIIYQEPYEGTKEQRVALRGFVGYWVQRLIYAVKLSDFTTTDTYVEFDEEAVDIVRIMKQITRRFMHENTSLGAQQRGHKAIIGYLFETFKKDIEHVLEDRKLQKLQVIPKKFHDNIYTGLPDSNSNVPSAIARLTMDCVSGLNEVEADKLFKRLTGASSGSVLDPIVA